jgi:hypothetical protein
MTTFWDKTDLQIKVYKFYVIDSTCDRLTLRLAKSLDAECSGHPQGIDSWVVGPSTIGETLKYHSKSSPKIDTFQPTSGCSGVGEVRGAGGMQAHDLHLTSTTSTFTQMLHTNGLRQPISLILFSTMTFEFLNDCGSDFE